MKFKNYRNHYNRSSRIYSEEDIWNMKVSDLFEYENDIMAQNNQIGIPESKELQASDNVIWIDSYTRDDGTQVEGHWRSLPDGAHYINPERQNKSRKQNSGTTGAAAQVVDRDNELSWLRQNNDDLFEKERQEKISTLMRYNAEQNKNRPDAKLFMDIALLGPKRVPSCKDYTFISSQKALKINRILSLKENKKIDSEYDGFIFSKESETAQRLNSSEEFRAQILKPENYDKKTGQFKREQLEIELKNDKNLHYSFGHMTVIPDRITSDGYLEGIGFDKYDYNLIWKNYLKDIYTTTINNFAAGLQGIGHLKPYFILIPVRVKIY